MNYKPTAFELGEKAGKTEDAASPNPFEIGSDQHNNFEVGRRFGASRSKSPLFSRDQTMRPDPVETDFDEEA